MWFGGHHHNPGGRRPAKNIFQQLDEIEMPQVVHLEGGLQLVLRQAPGGPEHGGVADQDVERPESAQALKNNT